MTTTTEPVVDLVRLANALASMPLGTVLSHRSAALLWGIWIPWFDGVEVTTPATDRGSRYTTSVQRHTVVAHRRIVVPQEDIVELAGLPVTCPARTWLDLAPILGIHDLVAAGDSALRAGAGEADIARRVAAMRGLRGAVRARCAAPLLNPRSRSRPESRIRAALVLSGLPEPEVNRAIHDEYGQWLAEPDLHYKEAKLALEYNGADHAGEKQMGKDSVRLLGLQRSDWTVRTYTAVHASQRLDEVASEVRNLLHRLAPELLTWGPMHHRVTT